MKALWGSILLLLGLSGVAAADAIVTVGHDDRTASTAYLRFFPDDVVVWAGDTVTWRIGETEIPHTVTQFPPSPMGFNSSPGFFAEGAEEALGAFFGPGGVIPPGATFEHTFDEPGTYEYFCKLHAEMKAVVTVTAAGDGADAGVRRVQAGGGSGETSIDRFYPAQLTVPAGTTVVWTNVHDVEPHTVTAESDDGATPAFDSSPAFSFAGIPEWFAAPGQGVLLRAGPYNEFSHTFAEPGLYRYFCLLHPTMQGSVTVLAKPQAVDGLETTGTSGGSAAPGPAFAATLALLAFAAVALRRRR